LHKNGIEKLEVIQRYSTELMLLKELIW
jgi:hypothetical protein